jgi:DNA-binding MarR family transcriptional regulator
MKPIADDAPSEADLGPFVLERFLPFRLSVLANRLTRMVARLYGERFGLTAPEWRTMAVLGRFGAMTANDVVERTAMDKVRVSRAVARLVAAGHITRRADTADRRRAILELTTPGVATYRQIVPLVRCLEEELLAELPSGERAALDMSLGKLERRVAHGGNGQARPGSEATDQDGANI